MLQVVIGLTAMGTPKLSTLKRVALQALMVIKLLRWLGIEPFRNTPMDEHPPPPKGRDLRARVASGLRRGIGIGWLRIILLALLDSLMLSLAWVIADELGRTSPSELFGYVTKSDTIRQDLGPFGSLILSLTRILMNVLGIEQLPFDITSLDLGPFPLMLLINLGILAASGHYGTDDKRRSFFRLIKSLILAQLAFSIAAFLYNPDFQLSRSTCILGWILSLTFVVFERLCLHVTIINLRRRGRGRQPVFLLGHPADARKAGKILAKTSQFEVRGEADLTTMDNRETWEGALSKIKELGVSEVFVCSWQSIEAPIFLFWDLHNAGIHLRVLPVDLKLPSQWTEIKMIGSFTTIRFRPPPIVGGDFWIKRCFDISLSAIALLMLLPLFFLIGVLIKLDSPGPVFYRQARMGLKGRHFKVWKFRTMVANAEQLQKKLEEQNEMKGGVLFKIKSDPRVTKIGKFLRDYSLDELPQLINVLFGEMSLVGPRPLPLRDAERFTEKHILRQEVLPGITGLWQVSGRSDVADSEQVFLLDLAYIQNWSISLDFQILLETIRVVLGREGAY